MSEAVDPYGPSPFSLTFVDDDENHQHGQTQDDFTPNFLSTQYSQTGSEADLGEFADLSVNGEISFHDDDELPLIGSLPEYACRFLKENFFLKKLDIVVFMIQVRSPYARLATSGFVTEKEALKAAT